MLTFLLVLLLKSRKSSVVFGLPVMLQQWLFQFRLDFLGIQWRHGGLLVAAEIMFVFGMLRQWLTQFRLGFLRCYCTPETMLEGELFMDRSETWGFVLGM
ncbi:hypothetical protein KC19_6G120600 [Ceratodon purpureus]|uniref:Uncharacterized protein n=1 Tax=Ceratodon purpureus TaxID=3225 RepID=A0A8T0HDL1_CERPU|nr:hypothetical protein KC19_6G120600 [Ceratodon purpureus]